MGTLSLIIIVAVGFVVGAVLVGAEIPLLKRFQFAQYIREEGPQSHLVKQGTPTMGGIAIFITLVLVTVVMSVVYGCLSTDTWVMILVTFLFGAIGFFDDYIKVAKKHNLGLRAWQKLVLQIIFAAGLAIYMSKFSGAGSDVWIPFANIYVDFKILYVPFVAFVVVAMANAVNLTDGLDGLSSGVTVFVSFFFGLAGLHFGHNSAAAFCCALTGACLGYLLFNKYPAKLFMGDTGSMALGGALASAAIIMKVEFMLVIAGFIYVMEALSVIIQVVSFKSTGKRVFKMAPIHHHFEMCGMKEQNVVKMFWAVAFICSAVSFLIIKL